MCAATIEYTLPKTQQPHPPAYLFLIDTCVSEDELNACKATILQASFAAAASRVLQDC